MLKVASMFGNYLVNTQSMGGKRRGLIYVSDDSAGRVPFAKCFQFMQATGMQISARVTYKGKVTLALKFNNTIGTRQYPVNINSTQYDTDYYPLCIAPKSYLFLKHVDISLTSHIQALNAVLPSCLYLAEENITFTSNSDNTQITVPYIVLYLKTSEAQIITVSGSQYYDLTAYQGNTYEIALPKIVMKTTQPVSMRFEGRYFFNPDYDNNNLEWKNLNDYVQCMVAVGVDFTPDAYNSGSFGTLDTKFVLFDSNDYLTLNDFAYSGTPFLFGCVNVGYYDDYQTVTSYGQYTVPQIDDSISRVSTGSNILSYNFSTIASQHFTINGQQSTLPYLFNDNISTFILRVAPITPLPVSPTIINPFERLYNNP